jgi:hypothetical protein
MAYIYQWRRVSEIGKRKFKGRHNGYVVSKVFKVDIPFYDKTEGEWQDFIREKMKVAKDKGIIDSINGKYDVRLACWTKPIFKCSLSEFGL